MTSRKNPSVKMVTGKVRRIKTGLTIPFNNASTTATIKAEKGDATTTPGRIYPTIIIDIVLIISLEIMIQMLLLINLIVNKGIINYK